MISLPSTTGAHTSASWRDSFLLPQPRCRSQCPTGPHRQGPSLVRCTPPSARPARVCSVSGWAGLCLSSQFVCLCLTLSQSLSLSLSLWLSVCRYLSWREHPQKVLHGLGHIIIIESHHQPNIIGEKCVVHAHMRQQLVYINQEAPKQRT